MPNPFGMPRIREVHGFAEIPASRSALMDLPGPLNWAQVPEFVEAADRNLGLEGDLVEYTQCHEILFHKIKPVCDSTRQSFLAGQSKSGLWQAYSETGQSGVRYSIVIDYYDHSETVLARDDLKAQVMQFFHREMARFLLSGQEPRDPLENIMMIGEKIMYRFGIPYRKMGFFFDHVKAMAGGISRSSKSSP